MLSDEEQHEIEAELAHYPTRQAASVEAMKIVQRHRGWVSDESLKDLAALLGYDRRELGRRRDLLQHDFSSPSAGT